jgi:hypothetical protein
MQGQPARPLKKNPFLSRFAFSVRDVSIAFLLFCSIVYLMAALRGIFPRTLTLAIIGSLLVLIVLVSLRAVVQLQVSSSRLSRGGAACLFLSFLAWEAPFDGGIFIVFSLLCLALSIGFYLGCSLLELDNLDGSKLDIQFLRPIIRRAVLLKLLVALFLGMRWALGWFLAMRLMLLVPAVVLVVELHSKRLLKKNQPLLIRGYVKTEWVNMLAYGFFFAGIVFLFLNLVTRFIGSLEGQHPFQSILVLIFVLSMYLFKPLREAYRHYFLSIAVILMLLVSAILYADTEPVIFLWVIIAVLVGAALGAGAISIKTACAARDPMARVRLFYVSVIIALLAITLYPVVHYLLGPQVSLICAPAILFFALLASFFDSTEL